MNNIRHRISHIFDETPRLKAKLKQRAEFNRFKNAFLTPIEREQVLFITIKDTRLLLALKHKALCIEFNHYKCERIISMLKQYKDQFPTLCQITEIYAYTPSHILIPKAKTQSQSMLYFKEHSNGEFKNLAKNKAIFDAFEFLREAIKRQWQAQSETSWR